MNNIVDDLLDSKYPPIRRGVTYVRYIRFATLCRNASALLPLPEGKNTGVRTGKNLGLFHFDCSVLYISNPDEVELMVVAVHYRIRTRPKASRSMLLPSILPQNQRLRYYVMCTRSLLLTSIPTFCTSCNKSLGLGKFLLNGQTVDFQRHALVRIRTSG